MTHKILERLEEDIQIIAKKNIELSHKSGKPLIDKQAYKAFMIEVERINGEPLIENELQQEYVNEKE